MPTVTTSDLSPITDAELYQMLDTLYDLTGSAYAAQLVDRIDRELYDRRTAPALVLTAHVGHR